MRYPRTLAKGDRTMAGRKRLVGNFPQAFSHIALVNAAYHLHAGERVRQRFRRDYKR